MWFTLLLYINYYNKWHLHSKSPKFLIKYMLKFCVDTHFILNLMIHKKIWHENIKNSRKNVIHFCYTKNHISNLTNRNLSVILKTAIIYQNPHKEINKLKKFRLIYKSLNGWDHYQYKCKEWEELFVNNKQKLH